MYNMNLLSSQIQTMYGRVLDLYQKSGKSAVPKPDILPIALKELGLASEELQVAVEELTRQNETLAEAQSQASMERLRYQSLFEFAPDALVLTSPSGTIQEVNRKGSALLNRHPLYLVGKPIVSLVVLEDRSNFRDLIAQLKHGDRVEFTTRFQRRDEAFEVGLEVEMICNEQDEPQWLRWKLHDFSHHQRITTALTQSTDTLLQQYRAFDCYNKGEPIFIEPQDLALVVRGVVKLTTLSDCGEDILIGLVDKNQVFGACLTALPIYQAIALTDVKLMSIPMEDIQRSPELSQALMPRILQRSQQMERFLMMRGQLRVCDRLNHFLLLLKEELGEPTSQGVRLKVRLTHQDFASACCSTRVTLTRLLGKLQQEGKICLDAQNYIVIKDI